MNRSPTIAVLLALPGIAEAQIGEPSLGRVEIAGTAPSACVVGAPIAGPGANATYEAGPSGGSIRISQLVDPATGQSVSAGMNLVIPVTCNGAHRLMVRSINRGLALDGNPGQGNGSAFASFVPYRVESDWGGQASGFLSNEPGAPEGFSHAARAGQMSLSISVPPGGQPLVAGTYSDEIVLEFQAAN
jgi:hypothetical protein